MASYRVGPYAAGGTGTFGGFIDYLDMLNQRDGGINGVKLTWEECETEYKNDRGRRVLRAAEEEGPDRRRDVQLPLDGHHLRAASSGRRPTRSRSSRSATAAPTPPTAASSRTSSRSSRTTGARTPPRSSSSG